MKNLINKYKLFECGLVLAPFVVWFSYFPNFHFGKSSNMNLEVSLAVIYLTLLSIVGLPSVFKNFKNLTKNRAIILTGVFVLWNFLSIFWSVNKTRTFLTAGMLSMLWLLFVEFVTVKNKSELWSKLRKSIIYSGVLMAIIAIAQSIYGTFTDWGLCGGCLATGFGFVRVSAFAVEPQFFGSLMIAPIFLSIEEYLQNKKSLPQLVIMLISLYLTLSRGAIFAFGLALIMLFIMIRSLGVKKILYVFGIVLISFCLGGLIHAISSELNPRISDGFGDSISKSINQMSLGKISISLPKGKIVQVEKQDSIGEKTVDNTKPAEKKALFDGYVEKSTNERTSLNILAIKTWHKDIFTIFFGVGLGSAGRAIYASFPQLGWEFEIVQNEYLAILLELGLIGLAIFLIIITGLLLKISHQKFLVAIIVAYLIQWIFFSGLPNLLHLYLLMAIFFIFSKYDIVSSGTSCYNANVNKK